MGNRVTIDGKEFSEQTVKEALKKHCNFESDVKPEYVQVDCFVAIDTKDSTSCCYLLGSLKEIDINWDKTDTTANEDALIRWYDKEEIEQIITGLQNLIED